MSKSQLTTFQVSEGQAGQRLDNFLFTRLKNTPKTHIYRMIRKGSIRVNKKRAKCQTPLLDGDAVSLPFLVEDQVAPDLEKLDVTRRLQRNILHQTDDWLVLNKPAGVVSQPGGRHAFAVSDYLSSALKCSLLPVHRLDRGTSGVMLFAKNARWAKILQEALADPRTQKIYQALCYHAWTGGDKSFKMHLEKQDRKMKVVDHGLLAVTSVKPVQVNSEFSHLEVSITTGRMHQIRVCLAHLGHPLLGDRLYGVGEFNEFWQSPWPFLHANKLSIIIEGQQYEFIAPLTLEKEKCLKTIF